MRRQLALAATISATAFLASVSPISEAAAPAVKPPSSVAVQRALSALDKLAQLGYTVNTPIRADRAIRHWQKVNGLVVDGIVGPQTLASLDLPVTTTKPAVRVNPPAMSVEAIIRDVWPAELADHAVVIATRESRLQPGVRNACCFGLFQLYWNVHRGWMSDHGVTSSDQLFDARTNAEMAYQLYLRDGGWGPWAT